MLTFFLPVLVKSLNYFLLGFLDNLTSLRALFLFLSGDISKLVYIEQIPPLVIPKISPRVP